MASLMVALLPMISLKLTFRGSDMDRANRLMPWMSLAISTAPTMSPEAL
jgi:hypothetical protein